MNNSELLAALDSSDEQTVIDAVSSCAATFENIGVDAKGALNFVPAPFGDKESFRLVVEKIAGLAERHPDENVSATSVWALGKLDGYHLDLAKLYLILRSSVTGGRTSVTYQALIALMNFGEDLGEESRSMSLFDTDKNKSIAETALARSGYLD